MSEIHSPSMIEGFRCDFTGCDAEVRLEIPMYSWTNTAKRGADTEPLDPMGWPIRSALLLMALA